MSQLNCLNASAHNSMQTHLIAKSKAEWRLVENTCIDLFSVALPLNSNRVSSPCCPPHNT